MTIPPPYLNFPTPIFCLTLQRFNNLTIASSLPRLYQLPTLIFDREMSYNIRFDSQNSQDKGDNEITTRGRHKFYLLYHINIFCFTLQRINEQFAYSSSSPQVPSYPRLYLVSFFKGFLSLLKKKKVEQTISLFPPSPRLCSSPLGHLGPKRFMPQPQSRKVATPPQNSTNYPLLHLVSPSKGKTNNQTIPFSFPLYSIYILFYILTSTLPAAHSATSGPKRLMPQPQSRKVATPPQNSCSRTQISLDTRKVMAPTPSMQGPGEEIKHIQFFVFMTRIKNHAINNQVNYSFCLQTKVMALTPSMQEPEKKKKFHLT